MTTPMPWLRDVLLPVGMWRNGDRVVIVDPTGQHQYLRACPTCNGKTGNGHPRLNGEVCATCGGWGAVR